MQRLLKRFRRETTPVREFLRTEAASGVLLGVATILALVMANSPFAGAYKSFLDTPIIAGIGSIVIDKPLLLWVNDGLMAIFFLIVGLEIKREIKYGELSTVKSATLPLACAVGGATVPALIYLAFNPSSPAARGWAIPMATDIAFAVGVLALLGSRVPSWAKLLLLATAVVDDLIAVVVIALFYTGELKIEALMLATGAIGLLIILNTLNIRHLWPYLLVGGGLWVAVLKSGIHATLAGVVLGFLIPAMAKKHRVLTDNEAALLRQIEPRLEGESNLEKEHRQQKLERLEDLVVESGSPLHRLEHKLHPFVAFAVIPIFAFANAGLTLDLGTLASALAAPISLGIIVGLFIGKQLGVFTVAYVAIRLGLTPLRPDRETLIWIYGLALLAGIGFTMSLFIGGLAFDDPARFEQAKIGILAGSLLSGVSGFLLLRRRSPLAPETSAD